MNSVRIWLLPNHERSRRRDCLAFCFLILFCNTSVSAAQEADHIATRVAQDSKDASSVLVTVRDCIRMARFGEGDTVTGSVAQFSPDRKSFVVVLRSGDLTHNTNNYRLLLWHTDRDLVSPHPQTLLTMSSTSTRDAIEKVTWLNDNETIVFLGEHPNEPHTLYKFNTRTRVLRRAAQRETNILSYGMSLDGKKIAYIAERPVRNLVDDLSRRQGILVSRQLLADLISLKERSEPGWGKARTELLVGLDGNRFRPVEVPGTLYYHSPSAGPFLSPDGRWAVVRSTIGALPAQWHEYSHSDDPELQRLLRPAFVDGEVSVLSRYILIDMETDNSRVLLDTPLTPQFPSEVAWSPDSRSIALGEVYLPLDRTAAQESSIETGKRVAVEVSLSDGHLTVISEDKLRLVRWDAPCGCLSFVSSTALEPKDPATVEFRKNDGKWKQSVGVGPQTLDPTIVVREGMNVAPRLFSIDVKTLTPTLLLDPNPQFKGLRFAPVKEIKWKGSDGHDVTGGLYYPIDYVAGKRYPLVIQTHDWDPNRFWIDGPWTTAYAAQPLAARNIFVLQASEDYSDLDSQDEIAREVSSLEGAVDTLDSDGLIDRNKVGLIGFSRTGLFVSYALVHSTYRFAAASIADGLDSGYLQYLSTVNLGGFFTESTEEINGGIPFGDGLRDWITRSSSGFRANQIHTPLRIEDNSPGTLLSNWEWFGALMRLRRPVEMVYMPEAGHILQRPWDRLISQQGNVDWFDFWLNGVEDSDSAKLGQYARWRQLRDLQRDRQPK